MRTKNQNPRTAPLIPLLFYLTTLGVTLNSNSSQAAPDPLASRLVIPAEADRAKSLKLVKEIYKSAYADRTPAAASKLAETLSGQVKAVLSGTTTKR